MFSHEEMTTIYKKDLIQEYDKWREEIPTIQFPSDYNIQMIPPSFGAIVRFRVKTDKGNVSVYLDCYDMLACFGEPYWEVYPYEGDVFRCAMNNVDELLEAIQKALDDL